MQCNDQSYQLFFLIAVLTVIIYSLGLPIYYLVTLRRRRHRLDEAKSVVCVCVCVCVCACVSMAPAAPPGKPRCMVSEGVWCLKVYGV